MPRLLAVNAFPMAYALMKKICLCKARQRRREKSSSIALAPAERSIRRGEGKLAERGGEGSLNGIFIGIVFENNFKYLIVIMLLEI